MSKIARNLRRAVLDAHAGKCHYCGEPATHVDHIIASAAGGSDEPSNLIAACRTCNLGKGARPLMDHQLYAALAAAARWPHHLGFLVSDRQLEAIKAYAKQHKLRLGEAIRELVNRGLDK